MLFSSSSFFLPSAILVLISWMAVGKPSQKASRHLSSVLRPVYSTCSQASTHFCTHSLSSWEAWRSVTPSTLWMMKLCTVRVDVENPQSQLSYYHIETIPNIWPWLISLYVDDTSKMFRTVFPGFWWCQQVSSPSWSPKFHFRTAASAVACRRSSSALPCSGSMSGSVIRGSRVPRRTATSPVRPAALARPVTGTCTGEVAPTRTRKRPKSLRWGIDPKSCQVSEDASWASSNTAVSNFSRVDKADMTRGTCLNRKERLSASYQTSNLTVGASMCKL